MYLRAPVSLLILVAAHSAHIAKVVVVEVES